jgi:hypothetical protein
MISRLTIFSLLLGLMLALGIFIHAKSERDRCNSYPAGSVPPKSESIVSGTREIEAPCSDWWIRQSTEIQILCIADLGLALIFLLNAAGDLRRWLQWRRGDKSH